MVKVGFDGEFVLSRPDDRLAFHARQCVEDSGNIGADGSGRPFEVRPHPSDDVVAVKDSIYNGLCAMVSEFPEIVKDNLPISIMHSREPLGAHIHFDTGLSIEHILLLDYLVAIPWRIHSDEALARYRISVDYGQLGDFRKDTYRNPDNPGEGYRTEYRTLGGFWGTPGDFEETIRIAQAIGSLSLENACSIYSRLDRLPNCNKLFMKGSYDNTFESKRLFLSGRFSDMSLAAKESPCIRGPMDRWMNYLSHLPSAGFHICSLMDTWRPVKSCKILVERPIGTKEDLLSDESLNGPFSFFSWDESYRGDIEITRTLASGESILELEIEEPEEENSGDDEHEEETPEEDVRGQ